MIIISRQEISEIERNISKKLSYSTITPYLRPIGNNLTGYVVFYSCGGAGWVLGRARHDY